MAKNRGQKGDAGAANNKDPVNADDEAAGKASQRDSTTSDIDAQVAELRNLGKRKRGPKVEDEAVKTGEITSPREHTIAEWVSHISEAYDAVQKNLIETGFRLVRAENELPGKITEIYDRLGFRPRRAQQLKDLYQHFGKLDTSKLPNSDRALNQLKKLDTGQKARAIEAGEIHQGLKAKDAQALVQRYLVGSPAEESPTTNNNYKLAHLRRLATSFENVKDAEIKEMVESLNDKEREKLRGTIQSLEWYLGAGASQHEKNGE